MPSFFFPNSEFIIILLRLVFRKSSTTGQEEEDDTGDTGLIHRTRQHGLQKPNPKLGIYCRAQDRKNLIYRYRGQVITGVRMSKECTGQSSWAGLWGKGARALILVHNCQHAEFRQGAQELWKKPLLNLAPSHPKLEPELQKKTLRTCFLFCYTMPGKPDFHFVDVTVCFRLSFSHYLEKTNLTGCDGTCL